MAFKDQINQNVGFFIYNQEFLFFSGNIGSPQAFNRFQIIPDLYNTCLKPLTQMDQSPIIESTLEGKRIY